MSRPAIIIGCGGHAHVVAETLLLNNYTLLGFLDDSYSGEQEYIYQANLIAKPAAISNYNPDEVCVFIAYGDNHKRQSTFSRLQCSGYQLPALIHPQAVLAQGVSIAEGALICMGAMLAVEVRIGAACIINTAVIVDHETEIGDFTHLAPGVKVAGRSKINQHVFVGMGAVIADGVEIGARSVIGANSIVLNNAAADSKILGIHSTLS